MNKELQDLAWSILPKEFREEVKKLYIEIEIELSKNKGATDNRTQQLRGMNSQLVYLFGHHNLTSDAAGEEMLTVPRKEVQERYAANERLKEAFPKGDIYLASNAINVMLQDLFGSKCLPDKVADEDNFASKEPKPAESKYHKGEKVRYNGYVYEVEGLIGKNRYALKGLKFNVDEDMIDPYEPYTEPLSQDLPENCDTESHISTECDKPTGPNVKSLSAWQDEGDPDLAQRLAFLNSLSNEQSEPKPAEPKFKVGDYARYKGDVHKVVATTKDNRCYLNKILGSIDESDLEPYTEPEEDLIPSNSGELKSQEADNQYRNLSKNIENFDKSNCNRLNIAAMAMQGILSNAERMKQYGEIAAREPESLTGLVARNALRYADALIDKVKKGVNNE